MKKQRNTIFADDRFDALVTELQSITIERVFNSNDEKLREHHEKGKAITEFVSEHKVDASLLVDSLRRYKCGSRSTLYLGYQFYRKYPSFDEVYNTEHGKNISWNKIRAILQSKKPVVKKVPRGCTQIATLYDVPMYVATTDSDLLDEIREYFAELQGDKLKTLKK